MGVIDNYICLYFSLSTFTFAFVLGSSVNSKLGLIQGKTVKHLFDGQEYSTDLYLGIPYAKPPTGPLRFKRPQPHGKFSAPLDATKFGSACPQNNMMDLGVDSIDENCLSLNVYVPKEKLDVESRYPVMIFIHGGGFMVGASNMVPGQILSSFGNIILVTINYRLGIFGFANTGDDKAQGNMGLWDQRLAIQWVEENIAAFGGDSARITIFGESAGSMSVFMQGMFPENKGLFQNIISESGTPAMPFGALPNNLDSLKYVANELKCETDDAGKIFNCLQTADVKTIMHKLGELGKDLEAMLKVQFLPTVDGDFVKRPPLETLLMSKDTPAEEIKALRSYRLINGINTAEGAMWLPYVLGNAEEPENAVISHGDMKNVHIANMLLTLTMGQPVPELLSSLVTYEYTDWSDPSNARLMYVKLMGDLFFNVPGVEFCLLHANETTSHTWLYSFDARIEKHFLLTPKWLNGANHGDELLPVFGYDVPEFGPLADLKDYKPPQWELHLSKRIMKYWSNFAKFGSVKQYILFLALISLYNTSVCKVRVFSLILYISGSE